MMQGKSGVIWQLQLVGLASECGIWHLRARSKVTTFCGLCKPASEAFMVTPTPSEFRKSLISFKLRTTGLSSSMLQWTIATTPALCSRSGIMIPTCVVGHCWDATTTRFVTESDRNSSSAVEA
jgi:hypothetical protein